MPEALFEHQSDELDEYSKLKFVDLQILDSIGLISFNSSGGFRRLGLEVNTRIMMNYFDRKIIFSVKHPELKVGKAMLTNLGKELSGICIGQYMKDYYRYMIKYWEGTGVEIIYSDPP